MTARMTPKALEARRLARQTVLVDRLMAHILYDANSQNRPAEHEDGTPIPCPLMTDSQVRAALGLLKKFMPDLKSVELRGNTDHPVIREIRRVIVDPANHPNGAGLPVAGDPAADACAADNLSVESLMVMVPLFR